MLKVALVVGDGAGARRARPRGQAASVGPGRQRPFEPGAPLGPMARLCQNRHNPPANRSAVSGVVRRPPRSAPPAGCRAPAPAGRASAGPAAAHSSGCGPVDQVEEIGGVGGAGRVLLAAARSAARARTRGPSPASRSATRRRAAAPRAAGCRRPAPRRGQRSRGVESRAVEENDASARLLDRSTARLTTASAASSVKPPAKTARRRKRACSSGVEQVVAPGDRVAHRPQAGRGVARAAGQQVEAAGQPRPAAPPARAIARPRRGQLDRQRQPVEPAADLGHRRRVRRRSGRSRGRPPGRARRRGGPRRTSVRSLERRRSSASGTGSGAHGAAPARRSGAAATRLVASTVSGGRPPAAR